MIIIGFPKNLRIIIPLIMSLISLTTVVVAAFLVHFGEIDEDYSVGEVDVKIEAFYEKDGVRQDIDINQVGGVIELNISDPTQLAHFNNFRVNIIINSTALTYFRIGVYEQFTLTYMIGDQKTVVAVAKEDYSKFAYQDGFFDNRKKDGFIYYKEKVRRNEDGTPKVIEFIGLLPEEDYHPIYESKYTLQVGFVIDAVQYIDGPQINWGLETPPWPDGEEW